MDKNERRITQLEELLSKLRFTVSELLSPKVAVGDVLVEAMGDLVVSINKVCDVTYVAGVQHLRCHSLDPTTKLLTLNVIKENKILMSGESLLKPANAYQRRQFEVALNFLENGRLSFYLLPGDYVRYSRFTGSGNTFKSKRINTQEDMDNLAYKSWVINDCTLIDEEEALLLEREDAIRQVISKKELSEMSAWIDKSIEDSLSEAIESKDLTTFFNGLDVKRYRQ